MKNAFLSIFFAGLIFTASTSYAQLPELDLPSTLTSTETTAKFYAGATADNGVSYANSFAFDEAIDILTEIHVELSHLNTVGNLYIIIVWEGQFFMRDEMGGYQIWDLTIDNLLAASPAKTLQAIEPLTIAEGVAFGPAGVSDTSLDIYLAYDTIAVADELFFSGTPLTVAIAAESTNAVSFQLFVDNISTPIIQTKCIICHSDTGIAAATSGTPSRLQYENSLQPNFQQNNYDTLVNFINNIPGGSVALLAKPQGLMAHTGAVQLVDPSTDFQNLEEFVNAVLAE